MKALDEKKLYDLMRDVKDPLYRINAITGKSLISPLDVNDGEDQIERGWALYAQAFKSAITGGNAWKNLQIVTIPTEVLWDDPDYGDYYFNVNFADAVCADGAAYRTSGASFSQRYRSFVEAIESPTVNLQKLAEARKAYDAYLLKVKNDDAYLQLLFGDWISHNQKFAGDPKNKLALYEWLKKYGKYYQVYTELEKLQLVDYLNYIDKLQEAYNGGQELARISAALVDTSGQVFARVPPIDDPEKSDQIRRQFRYEISEAFHSWSRKVKDPGYNGPSFKFAVQHNSGEYNYKRQEVSAGLGIGIGFFGLLAFGQRTTVSIDTHSDEFSFEFRSKAIKSFMINPGAWYMDTAISLYSNGPFAKESPVARLAEGGKLFGPGGFISSRPHVALVGYKPELKVKLKRADYESFYEATRGAGGFCIGPFVIGGGSYYSEQHNVRWDEQSSSITIFDGPDSPMLLAVDSVTYP
jgi:hypothetical protein